MSTSAPHYTEIFPNPPAARKAVLKALAVKPWLSGSAGIFYIGNARVIDMNNESLYPGLYTFKVTDGCIEWLTTTATANLQDDGPYYDVGGRFICPGLIDAHVHVTAVPGVKNMSDMLRLKSQELTLRCTYVLKGMLQRGFTTVRDTGGATKFIATAIQEGLIEGPRLFQCGKALSQTGGHGDLVAPGESGGDGSGCCGGVSLAYGRTADGVPGVLKAVREELKQGADFIKIMAGGGVSSETDGLDSVQYTSEEIRAITATAWNMGKKMCTAHAYTVEAIRHAIDNGVRGIEHGNLLDEPTARLMKDKGVYLTPTVSCNGIMARQPFEHFLSSDSQIKSGTVARRGLEALKIAHDVGVSICYGTDLLISMHALQTEEFLVRSSVLPAAAILKSATVTPAKMLNQEGKLGVIAPGAFADFIILDRNPLEDITVLDRPEVWLRAVFKDGRIVSGSCGDLQRPVTM